MWTLYDDREILFVNRVVMSSLIAKGLAETQEQAWKLMKHALKECLNVPQPAPRLTFKQTTLAPRSGDHGNF